MHYRPDIDGLRSVAVMAVVLFHVDLQFIPGGFTGVDVFFVLSGFLITANVCELILKKKFSFRSFYARRVLRLFPALLFTVVSTFVAAVATFTNEDLTRLSLSAIYALCSVSNIGFWKESGYFDVDACRKPLLHTWSLAIEEQFYLIWPALLVFLLSICRHNRKLQCVIIVLLLLTSVLASEYTLHTHGSAAFFLGPFRIYEFMSGAMLHWLPKPKAALLKNLFAFGGIVFLFISIFLFHPGLPFPGLSATVPCLGTALLLHSGGNTRVATFLSKPPLLYIGHLSYSLYLTHWPIIVIYKYVTGHEVLNIIDILLLLLFSLLSAILLHDKVETRFYKRPQKITSLPKPLSNTSNSHHNASIRFLFLIPLLCLLFLHCHKMKGYPWRSSRPTLPPSTQTDLHIPLSSFDELVTNYHHTKRKRSFDEYGPITGSLNPNAPQFLLLGDSLAHQFLPLAHYYGTKYNVTFHVWWYGACPPLPSTIPIYNPLDPGVPADLRQRECLHRLSTWFESLPRYNFSAVFIAANWLKFFEPPVFLNARPMNQLYLLPAFNSSATPSLALSRELFPPALSHALSLIRATQAIPIVVSQASHPGLNPASCLSRPTFFWRSKKSTAQSSRCVISTRKQMLDRVAWTDRALKKAGAEMLQVSDILCDNEKEGDFCRVVWLDKVLYRNTDHLSDFGAMYIALRWEEMFKGILLRIKGNSPGEEKG